MLTGHAVAAPNRPILLALRHLWTIIINLNKRKTSEDLNAKRVATAFKACRPLLHSSSFHLSDVIIMDEDKGKMHN